MEKTTKIIEVLPGSIAEEAEIEPGDVLLQINKDRIIDIIDYEVCSSEENLILTIQKMDGSIDEIAIEKDSAENLGMIFDSDLMDKQRKCINHCVFCFIDQLPKNMRSSLYHKDDDWRLSFIMGNYITLTNVTNSELNRIIARRVSPLYISIHATDPIVRGKMLRTKKDSNILTQLKRLADAGLNFHCQIVLCPGINDGTILEKTIQDLRKLQPYACSIAIVPVGLTKYREGLFPLRVYTREEAQAILKMVEFWQDQYKNEIDHSFIYIADEFYMIAGEKIPHYDRYEDFPQIENGVGLLAKFKKEFDDVIQQLPTELLNERKVTVITGMSAAPFIQSIVNTLNKIQNLHVTVIPVENKYFGLTVTASGLLTGIDIVETLKNKVYDYEIFVPQSLLRDKSDMLLDNMTLYDLQCALRANVCAIDVNGEVFAYELTGIKKNEVET